MKKAVEIDSGVMTYLPDFKKIGSRIRNCIRGTHTHTRARARAQREREGEREGG
jgi:hypothetical protein